LALAAYDAESGKLIGVIAYAASGELAGVVEAHFRGVGLGTLLVHQAAERARKAGVEVLHVELHPGSEDTAAMLRDSGFATHWDIDYPIARVALQLTSGPRPGWTTPKPRAADGA
jgi:GNAT superfamily N-acetyltransferase